MSSEVGNGQVAIFPTFKGFKGKVAAEVEGAAKTSSSRFSRIFSTVGAKTGKDVGKSFKSGVTAGAAGAGTGLTKRLTAEVASASKQVSAARIKEQDATGKLRVAEAQLSEARSKNVAGSARLIAAEERAASAARSVTSAQETTKAASTRLAAAQDRVRASTDQAGDGANRAQSKFRSFGSSTVRVFGSVSSAAGGVARVVGTGIGFAAGALAVAGFTRAVGAATGGLRDSITAASNLQQSVGGVEAVFGKSSKAVNTFSKNAAKSVGLSANAYNELATVIGSQLKNSGTPLDQIASKTDGLVRKGADMAAVFGGPVSDAVDAISSALKGERDPIERYGVSLNQAKIDAQAAALGFKKVGASYDSNAQSAATLALITKQTASTQGQFAAQSNTLAEQQQILGAQTENLKAKFGTALLPAIVAVVGAISNGMSPALDALQPVFAKVETGAGRIAEKINAFSSGLKGKSLFQGLFEVALPNVDFSKFTTGISSALTAAKPLLGAFFSYVQNIVPAVGGALAQLGPALANVFVQLGPALQQVLPLLGQAIVTLLPSAVSILQALIPLIPPLAQILVALAPAVKFLADGLAFLITNGLVPLVQFQAGIGAVFTAFQTGSSVAGVALQGLSGKFGPVFQAVTQFAIRVGVGIRTAIGFFQSFATGVGTFIGQSAAAIGAGILRGIGFFQRLGQVPGIAARAIGSFVSTIAAGLGRAVSAIGSGIGRAVSTIGQLPGRAAAVLGSLGGRLFSSGAALIQGFINGIASKIGQIAGVAGRAVAEAAKFFPHSPAEKGAFSGRGYTLYSGRTAAVDFARGMQQGIPQITRSSNAATQAAVISAKAARATSPNLRAATTVPGRSAGDRPIYMDGTLFGVLREMANGEAQIVLNQQNASLNMGSRLGKQSTTFVR